MSTIEPMYGRVMLDLLRKYGCVTLSGVGPLEVDLMEENTPDRERPVDAWELIEELKAISKPTALVEFSYGDLGKDFENVEAESESMGRPPRGQGTAGADAADPHAGAVVPAGGQAGSIAGHCDGD